MWGRAALWEGRLGNLEAAALGHLCPLRRRGPAGGHTARKARVRGDEHHLPVSRQPPDPPPRPLCGTHRWKHSGKREGAVGPAWAPRCDPGRSLGFSGLGSLGRRRRQAQDQNLPPAQHLWAVARRTEPSAVRSLSTVTSELRFEPGTGRLWRTALLPPSRGSGADAPKPTSCAHLCTERCLPVSRFLWVPHGGEFRVLLLHPPVLLPSQLRKYTLVPKFPPQIKQKLCPCVVAMA